MDAIVDSYVKSKAARHQRFDASIEEKNRPDLELDSLNSAFASVSPEKIVSWAASEFGESLVMSSSFGVESAALIHLATRHLPHIKIIFVDTGYLFPETFAFMEQLRHRLNLNIWTYRTRNDPFTYLRNTGEGDPTFRQNVEGCCAANKNEPFERAMAELQPRAWLRGIRRSQAETRQGVQFVETSPRYNCLAISPLLNWSTRQIHEYLKQHDLPRHPLFEKGYTSIGCNPLSCTRPISIGEDDRAGRWTGKGKIECGINLTDSLDSAKL
ncbi:MAG TPA: phosphoadenylyl-sulfate reductase [Tepidisphaeraceae bacterium]|jgi:phosphoadenosine phosphosulfate reductase